MPALAAGRKGRAPAVLATLLLAGSLVACPHGPDEGPPPVRSGDLPAAAKNARGALAASDPSSFPLVPGGASVPMTPGRKVPGHAGSGAGGIGAGGGAATPEGGAGGGAPHPGLTPPRPKGLTL